MRVNFYVKPDGPRRWRLLRGDSRIRSFDERHQAVRAAEGFAQAVARRGEWGIVSVRDPSGARERREFAPRPSDPPAPGRQGRR